VSLHPAVAAAVVAQMAAMGADETVSARVRVEGDGLGPEAAARQARYAVLDQIAERYAARLVLLGHTRDDQAETVLLGLARGSGGRSLAGMRRGYDRYRRPLLDVARDDTATACQVEGLTWWSDPHNDDPGYARVRVRRRVLPVLEAELGPGVAATLARTADQVRADMDLLDDLAEAAYAELDGLPVAELAARPGPIRTRVLRLAALAAGAPASELTYEHVLALDGLVTAWRGQRWIDLPGHLRAVRRDGRIELASTRQ
jgi:tRNA(Ile)-lysidine synthase